LYVPTERSLGALTSVKGICPAASNETALNKGPCLPSFPDILPKNSDYSQANCYNWFLTKMRTRRKWVRRRSPVQWLFDDRLFLKDSVDIQQTFLKHEDYPTAFRSPVWEFLWVNHNTDWIEGSKWRLLVPCSHYAAGDIWKRHFTPKENSGIEITWLSWLFVCFPYVFFCPRVRPQSRRFQIPPVCNALFRKAPFSRRSSVDVRPDRRNKVAFSNFSCEIIEHARATRKN